MTNDIDTLDVYIESPPGTGEDPFYLKAEKVDRSYSNSVILRSILQVAGDVAGRDLDRRTETIDINGVIQGTDPDTYPDLVSIDTDAYNTATEKEMALTKAFIDWGPTTSGFARLHWGPRTESGLMTKLLTSEDASGQRGPGKYTFTIEWSYMNIQI